MKRTLCAVDCNKIKPNKCRHEEEEKEKKEKSFGHCFIEFFLPVSSSQQHLAIQIDSVSTSQFFNES